GPGCLHAAPEDERNAQGRVVARRVTVPAAWGNRSRSALLAHGRQRVTQYDGLVVPFILRAIHERQRPLACGVEQQLHPDLLHGRDELLAIAVLEAVPALRVVPEPLPQPRAGRELLRPFGQREARPASS